MHQTISASLHRIISLRADYCIFFFASTCVCDVACVPPPAVLFCSVHFLASCFFLHVCFFCRFTADQGEHVDEPGLPSHSGTRDSHAGSLVNAGRGNA